MNQITEYRFQITEIYQITGIRKAVSDVICKMLPAKFLPNATRYLLNASEGGV